MENILIVIVVLFFYLTPAIIARNNKNFGQVLAIDLLLGWTFIGWVIALVMALKNEE